MSQPFKLRRTVLVVMDVPPDYLRNFNLEVLRRIDPAIVLLLFFFLTVESKVQSSLDSQGGHCAVYILIKGKWVNLTLLYHDNVPFSHSQRHHDVKGPVFIVKREVATLCLALHCSHTSV